MRASAQEPAPLRVWLTGALGPGLSSNHDEDEQLALSVQVAGQKNAHQFTLRAVTLTQLNEGNSFLDVGLLYGRAISRCSMSFR